ncbi:Lrp/AsnC family transcriptional regulator [Vogesella indigofera]|uniref:Lrp/AsnC family transcriptional regulator n=1 Tax=Vogesella indigofera TaxID=45465 RepID=UPI00234EE2F5|nr:Lrp/AsnC family transcriptional regulator [Vogesella indigofera]MDC7709262.1 Lrp/AsnC family transcriptional regulator [Vogesella indigofera]
MDAVKLDSIDRRILHALQRDGRLQNIELARTAGLSPSSCLRRVKLLEARGVIKRYVAVLDGAKVGAGLSLFARVWFKAQDADTTNHFIASVRDMAEVVECHIMAGECDALLRIVTQDLASYRKFHAEQLTRIASVQSVKTEVPMETVKLTHALPL